MIGELRIAYLQNGVRRVAKSEEGKRDAALVVIVQQEKIVERDLCSCATDKRLHVIDRVFEFLELVE